MSKSSTNETSKISTGTLVRRPLTRRLTRQPVGLDESTRRSIRRSTCRSIRKGWRWRGQDPVLVTGLGCSSQSSTRRSTSRFKSTERERRSAPRCAAMDSAFGFAFFWRMAPSARYSRVGQSSHVLPRPSPTSSPLDLHTDGIVRSSQL